MMNTYIHMNKSPSSNTQANKYWPNTVSKKKKGEEKPLHVLDFSCRLELASVFVKTLS